MYRRLLPYCTPYDSMYPFQTSLLQERKRPLVFISGPFSCPLAYFKLDLEYALVVKSHHFSVILVRLVRLRVSTGL